MAAIATRIKSLPAEAFMWEEMPASPVLQPVAFVIGRASSIPIRLGHTRRPPPLEKVAAIPQSNAPARANWLCPRLAKRTHAANESATTITFWTEQSAQHEFS